MNDKNIDKFLSWGRYLYWSDILLCRFYEFIEISNDTEGAEGWYFYALMSQWYASVWVVIEGWLELKIKDDIIDGLLKGWPDFCNLLRKYRNCVYHYQKSMTDNRFVEFLRKGDEHAYWIRSLHDEFQRFFWEYPEKITNSKEHIQEIREMIKEVIGWVPNNRIPVHRHNLEEVIQKREEILAKANDYTSPEAKALLDAISQLRKIIKETSDNPSLTDLNEIKKSNKSVQ